VWDQQVLTYPGNYVVEWPAGSMNLWITEGGGLAFNVEPGTDPHWMPCQEMPDEGGPCAGLDVIGVWEPGTLVEFGQVYEYPAGLGMFYQIVIPFNTPTNVGAPGVDLDAWELLHVHVRKLGMLMECRFGTIPNSIIQETM